MNNLQGLTMELEVVEIVLVCTSSLSLNITKPKPDQTLLFYYGMLVLIFRLQHQTLKIAHGKSTSQGNSNKLKQDEDMLFRYGVPVSTFWLLLRR
ncbi:hypothetical protein EVAR_30007_1 [Eumeta japonica]|uniref:Uncharacterized protein n=1 Tax=Eumeta variegata TaxID=151549 RepID=A0A4C1VWR7_EUMVA|nr:hypothetical protein EVAR_30007_1 [Eumeta japonica]